MKDYIEERVLELAGYIIETGSTVRAAAKKFKISKTIIGTILCQEFLISQTIKFLV